MATWSVKPQYKKSIIERQTWVNGGESFVYETGWRWGEFTVFTEDDNPPKLEAGVDIFNCDYETQMEYTDDGCWDDYDWDDCSEETKERLEAFFEEGNSVFDLEEEGWYNSDTEMIIDCDMDIVMVEPTGEKVEEQPSDAVENPPAKWPF